jgi:hypothetical protein
MIAFRYHWPTATLLLVACLSSGCPRVLYLDYQPANSLKGSGPVQVAPFLYGGHSTGLMKQKELESGSHDVESLYLSQDIGEFFTNAVRKELSLSGYNVQPGEARIVSGTIEKFFLDYVGEVEQRFEILVTFNINRTGAAVFASSCHSNLQQAKDWMKSGSLIERGIKDCIEQFIESAQAARAL